MPRRNAPLQDAKAFSQLYESTHLFVFRFIYGLHGGPLEEVEDLTAETFIRAWKARSSFEGDEQAATSWLIQIARNLVIDSYRRQKLRKETPFDTDNSEILNIEDLSISPERSIENQEQWLTLWKLLQDLPFHEKELLILRYILGWRVNRIAVHLGMLENTVSVQIRRILHKIRSNWPENTK